MLAKDAVSREGVLAAVDAAMRLSAGAAKPMSVPAQGLILVVDDNEVGRYTESRILRDAGYDVIEGSTGDDALRLITELSPRLVLLDVNLPGVDGWEVCRRLKANPDTASVAVLQVSATHVREEDTVGALEGGAEAPRHRADRVGRAGRDRAGAAPGPPRGGRPARRAGARAGGPRGCGGRQPDEGRVSRYAVARAALAARRDPHLGGAAAVGSHRRAGRARALAAIERNTRHQAKLIEDLLDVSRIISGKMRLDVAVVNLTEVVDAALDGVRHAADAKVIRLDFSHDATVGPVSGDPARLQQVVWNLLSNAVKFTPSGGRVAVRVERVASQAEIEVTDSGRGIDPAFLPHIFERFRQADASTKRTDGGLGLGLAIVRHLVELHGGSVSAQSRGFGQGSTFTVHLPLRAVSLPLATAMPARTVTPPPPMAPLPDLNGLRVLVLDDEPDAREAIAAVLEGCAAEVTAVATVREALAAVERGAAQVVVSDIAMPSEDRLRLHRPAPPAAGGARRHDSGRGAHRACGVPGTATDPRHRLRRVPRKADRAPGAGGRRVPDGGTLEPAAGLMARRSRRRRTRSTGPAAAPLLRTGVVQVDPTAHRLPVPRESRERRPARNAGDRLR